MIQLPNGCKCSDIKVSPANWDQKGASITKNWRIYYRFFDPSLEQTKYVEVKVGINRTKDIQERRALVRAVIDTILFKLKHQGFNPLSNTYITPIDLPYDIDPETPFIKALYKAKDLLKPEHEIAIDMKAALKVMDKAARELRISQVPISKISIRYLTMLMMRCGQINPRWSARRHNMYRSYLTMLFKLLAKLEAVPANPAYDIDKMKEFKKLKAVLTEKQRERVREALSEKHPAYWNFLNIFFHSGSRMPELLRVRKSDVRFEEQKCKYLVKKGRVYKEVERTIKNIAVPYWKFFLDQAKDDDFLFGVGFAPASKPMCVDTPARWWLRIVKKEMGIKADFYSLKHLNTDEVTAQLGSKDAATLNAHENEQMVLQVYAVGEKERQHKRLKQIANSL